MGAVRLKTRRYKVRRGGKGGLALVMILALLAAGAYLWRGEKGEWHMLPAPTLSPQESAADERMLTLAGTTWYALQLGVFDQLEAAQEVAASYQSRGAAGFVAGSGPYRVLAAAYQSRADAQAVQQQLRTLHQVESYVSPISRNEITLRLTGQAAQLTALSDALIVLDQTANQMAALSQGLDQRALEEAPVRQALISHRETVDALRARLTRLFGPQPHQAVAQVMCTLDALALALEGAKDTRGEAKLGAQVKYCQLLCIVGMDAYAAGLSP